MTFDEIWSGDFVEVVCVGRDVHNCVRGMYRRMVVKDDGCYMMLEPIDEEDAIVYVNTKYITSVLRHKRPERKDEDEVREEDIVWPSGPTSTSQETKGPY